MKGCWKQHIPKVGSSVLSSAGFSELPVEVKLSASLGTHELIQALAHARARTHTVHTSEQNNGIYSSL